MADNAEISHDPRLAAEQTDRREAAERAHRRAGEAGDRASELHERLVDLQEHGTGPQSQPELLERSRQAAADAVQHRDEAERRDRAAHVAAAQAHDRAALAYERLAETAAPDQRTVYLRKAGAHREEARSTRHNQEPPA